MTEWRDGTFPWMVALAVAMGGCDGSGGGGDDAAPRFLLADREARAAGWSLDGAPLGPLPVTLRDDAVLRGPAGERALDVPAGALAHLRGGAIELYALDADVRGDRLQIEAGGPPARTLAAALGATAIALDGLRWELTVEGIYAAAAQAIPVDGVAEVMPVPYDAEAGLAVAAWTARPSADQVALGAARATATTAAPAERLIGPATGPHCEDPVVGMWVAKAYRPEADDWHDHELTITRRGDRLVVRGVHHQWEGDKHGGVPPLCDRGGPAWQVFETEGRAAFDGARLRVRGTRVVRSGHSCGLGVDSDYNLDTFSGLVAGDTYAAVNNDGELAVNRPYVFQRVRCAAGR